MTDLATPTKAGHAVQFYEDEEVLAGAVADFIADGLTRGERVVVVATETHADDFRSGLEARGLDVEDFVRRGRLTLLDAHETLPTFMVGPVPDPVRFASTMETMIERLQRDDPGSGLRFYGEMVDVLCRIGNIRGAIRLEELWNELASRHTFELLCGYSMATFYKAGAADQFNDVCRQHTRVIAAESFSPYHDVRDIFAVGRPELQSSVLASEIRRREEIERRFAALRRELGAALDAIAGCTELLTAGEHGALNAAQRDAVERIDRSSRHLLSLVGDL